MTQLENLINAVLEEAKRQGEHRKEYLSLIHNLIGNTEKENDNVTWRLSFRWYSDVMGGEMISFSRDVSGRKTGLSKYDQEKLQETDKEMDKCMNYLLDCGTDVADTFIQHLTTVALPQFLQDRYPRNYEISRNMFTAAYGTAKLPR